MTNVECRETLKNPDTRVLSGAGSKDYMILVCVVLTQYSIMTSWRTEGRTNRQRDGQTDTFAIAKTGHLHSKLLNIVQ